MNKVLSFYIFFSFCLLKACAFKKNTFENYELNQFNLSEKDGYPVIGILDSPVTRFLKSSTIDKRDTMIPSSYVKFIEYTGAHVLRIPYKASESRLDYFMQNINGLILTGGSQLVRNETTKMMSEYGRKVKYLLKKAIEINENGNTFPVYGICNGFSQIVCSMSTNDTNICDVLTYKHHKAEREKIQFTDPLIQPFSSMKKQIIDRLQKENQLLFYHSLYLEPQFFQQNRLLNSQFQISSQSSNYQDVQFISSIHHINYPIFADVFHPEKAAFEWKPNYISHKKESIFFSFYIAKYFIQQASKNTHTISEELIQDFLEFKEDSNLIETPTLSYQSIYLFKYNSTYLQ
ncbi:class I glutamine amidotransferase (macronuclear) [Tetrahymena thermophila SB210]|uniref:folate gamma-glutamyl hydrolase n=1 Tax=Tetrahymena thermophila (strain SB210) TaxID=312017 RepID=Q22MT7_TETTS|nr:class I glutamine amidotransferase [Tetrahymena thermophila SB210]EAR86417.1 class I glutamine amidotransferase [Tetrahymena thermophila SB210]|eukprot:XP_976933.1 class I glutamine amidotransferase [Tetrahymena thermophila SB210]